MAAMDVDGPAFPAGPKGVAGILLEDLERRALAEAAAEEEAARAAAAGNGAGSGSASKDPSKHNKQQQQAQASGAVGGTYVPGANKKQKLDAAASGAANGVASSKPSTSSNLGASTSGGTKLPDGGATSDSGANAKKPERKQPTIRLTLQFPPYQPGREILAKHVPIFNVHDIADKQGLLLPPQEDADMDDASSSGGSDDEGGDDDNDRAEESNAGEETGAEKDADVGMTDSQRATRDAMELVRRSKKPVLTRKRVRDRDEGYDVNDPFVDDSELLINEPKFQPKPNVDGFCAIVGEVELVDDPKAAKSGRGRTLGSKNKPKVALVQPDGTTKMVSETVAAREAKKLGKEGSASDVGGHGSKKHSESPAPTAGSSRPDSRSAFSHVQNPFGNGPATPPTSRGTRAPSSTSGLPQGSAASPINLDEEEDKPGESSPGKNTRQANVFAFDPSPAKGGKKYTYHTPSAQLQPALDRLEAAVAKESFVPKNKFPPALKPILVEVAMLAMKTGEYDENFFNIMPNIFPYNRFTMHKMIKREVCEPRCEELEDEIAVLTEQLKKEVNKTLPAAKAAYDAALKVWEEEYAEWKKANGGAVSNGSGRPERANSLTPVGSDDAAGDKKQPGEEDGAPPKPNPKFKFSEAARMHLFQIMTHSQEITERKTEKAEVENAPAPSVMNATKARYAELLKIWPDGFMTSNQLSREMTAAKKKIEKQMEKGK